MKGLLLQNGDLALGPSGYAMVEGQAKVRQDLGVAVREPVGCDRFHPRWGSVLGDYVGRPIDGEVRMLVESEIRRLVHNYILVQADYVQRDALAGRRPRFATAELLRGVKRISVAQQDDKLRVFVEITTLSGTDISLATEAGL